MERTVVLLFVIVCFGFISGKKFIVPEVEFLDETLKSTKFPNEQNDQDIDARSIDLHNDKPRDVSDAGGASLTDHTLLEAESTVASNADAKRDPITLISVFTKPAEEFIPVNSENSMSSSATVSTKPTAEIIPNSSGNSQNTLPTKSEEEAISTSSEKTITSVVGASSNSVTNADLTTSNDTNSPPDSTATPPKEYISTKPESTTNFISNSTKTEGTTNSISNSTKIEDTTNSISNSTETEGTTNSISNSTKTEVATSQDDENSPSSTDTTVHTREDKMSTNSDDSSRPTDTTVNTTENKMSTNTDDNMRSTDGTMHTTEDNMSTNSDDSTRSANGTVHTTDDNMSTYSDDSTRLTDGTVHTTDDNMSTNSDDSTRSTDGTSNPTNDVTNSEGDGSLSTNEERSSVISDTTTQSKEITSDIKITSSYFSSSWTVLEEISSTVVRDEDITPKEANARTLKLTISITFLCVAAIGAAVLITYVVRVRRRTIKYDEITLLP